MKKQLSNTVKPTASHEPVPIATTPEQSNQNEENLHTILRTLKRGNNLRPAQVLTLQQTLGNRVVRRLLQNRPQPGSVQRVTTTDTEPVLDTHPPLPYLQDIPHAAQQRDTNQTMNAIAHAEQNRQFPLIGPQQPVTIFDQAANVAQQRDPVQTVNAIQDMEQNRQNPVLGPHMPVTIFDQAANAAMNLAAPNTAALDAKATKRHNRAKNDYIQQKAAERRTQKRLAAQQLHNQQMSQPRSANPLPPDMEAQQKQLAETNRQQNIQTREISLARDRIQEARLANAALIAEIQLLINRSAPPSALNASFMNALEIAGVAANLVNAQAALATAQGHNIALNNADLALNVAPVGVNTLQAAYTVASTVPVDIALLKTNINADYRTHLTGQAVDTKIQALLSAAKTDVTKKLGGQAAARIFNGRANKNKAAIDAEIAAAVHAQHNPSLSDWLKLLQIESKKNGTLRIKKLRNITLNGGTSYGSHLSVYIDQVTVPAAGVAATAAQVLDAILPPGYGSGAHLTMEFQGEIAPAANPHYYRGAGGAAGTFKRNAYPDNTSWVEVQADMTRVFDAEIVALTERVQRFLDNLGRQPGDV